MQKTKEIETMYDMLLNSKEFHGEITAIRSDHIEMTYSELFDRAICLACKYQNRGYSGKMVELVPELSIKWLLVYLGLTMAGAKVVIHDPSIEMQDLRHEITWSGSSDELYSEDNNVDISAFKKPNCDDVAIIIYTSGTTGKPKGVMLTHKNIVKDAILGYERIGVENLSAGDITIPILPIFHMYGITAAILSSLYIGMTLFILDDIKYFTKKMAEIKPKVIYIVPMIARTLYQRIKVLMKQENVTKEMVKTKLFGKELDMLVCGGAPLDPSLTNFFKEFNIHLLNGYGITECSPVITVSNVQENKEGSVGNVRDCEFVSVQIINGTIHVSGDIVMKGYFNEKQSVLVEHEGRLWFNTKDIGYIDEEGFLFITGRVSNLIILEDGNNISPEFIESYFNEFEMIEESIVYVDQSYKVAVLGVFVLLNPIACEGLEKTDIQDELYRILKVTNERLPYYSKVRSIQNIEKEFPKNKFGKILRKEVNQEWIRSKTV